MIGIIDYRMGNLRSVQKAFERVGAEAVIAASPAQLANIDRLVLPGVGAFADGVTHLTESNWIEPIVSHIESGKPFLGICLGMQLLFEDSLEGAPSPDQPVRGLGVLPGHVIPFAINDRTPRRMKIPHMGWNTISWTRDDPMLRGVHQGAAAYFVHGFLARPDETAAQPITSATTDYGGPLCASVWRNNIWATQFHPEKSQRVGLKMLANFVAA